MALTHADRASQLRMAAGVRALVMLALLGTSVVLHQRAGGVMDAAVQNVYAFLVVACVAAVVTYLWLRNSPVLPRAVLPLTLVTDLALITAITAYSGGVDSIFSVLYVIVVLEAAALSGLRASIVTATAATLAYGAVALLQQTGTMAQAAHLRIGITQADDPGLWAYAGLRVFAFYLVALLAGYLARRIGYLERRQEALLENFASGYLAANCDGELTFINSAGRRILGTGPQALSGTPLGELFRTDPPGQNPVSLSLRVRKEFYESACTHWRTDGLAVPLNVTTAFIRSAGHEIGGVMAHFSDQTLVRELQDTLRQQDRLALAGEFSASLAHEVRNPVGAMRGAAQELLADENAHADPVERQLLQIIVREADQLNHVVSHFLDYARVSLQDSAPVSVPDVLEEVIDLLTRDTARTQSIDIETQNLSNGAEVAADRNLLKEAFLNIAQNAVDAMPDGGTLRIVTQPAPRLGLLEVRFEDTGHGMTEEDIQNIFQPFFTKKSTGTGLGLAIVHRIVEAHGGDIQVFSRPGAGTQMHIRLPLAE